MLNRHARAGVNWVFTPVAKLLLRLRISPDAVTIVGTLGVMAGALAWYPRGELFWGTMVITAFVFADNVDGIMARHLDRPSAWGAFLDSTLDRFADSAIFAGIALWAYGVGDEPWVGGTALACLVLGSIVSYARARAEGLGMTASVGIAERAERLIATLLATGLVGVGVSVTVLIVVLAVLALASFITVIQRIWVVRGQALGGK